MHRTRYSRGFGEVDGSAARAALNYYSDNHSSKENRSAKKCKSRPLYAGVLHLHYFLFRVVHLRDGERSQMKRESVNGADSYSFVAVTPELDVRTSDLRGAADVLSFPDSA